MAQYEEAIGIFLSAAQRRAEFLYYGKAKTPCKVGYSSHGCRERAYNAGRSRVAVVVLLCSLIKRGTPASSHNQITRSVFQECGMAKWAQ